MGAVAIVVLMAAEFSLAGLVLGRSLDEQLSAYFRARRDRLCRPDCLRGVSDRASLEALTRTHYDHHRNFEHGGEGGVHEAPADWRLPMRQDPLRDHRGTALGLYVPLHRLPTPDQQRLLDGRRGPREGFPAQRRRAAFAPAPC